MTLRLEFERMYDDRDEWIVYIAGGLRRGNTDVIVQGDPRDLSDDDVVTFRCSTGRETMRLGDLKRDLLRPEAKLPPESVEDHIELLVWAAADDQSDRRIGAAPNTGRFASEGEAISCTSGSAPACARR